MDFKLGHYPCLSAARHGVPPSFQAEDNVGADDSFVRCPQDRNSAVPLRVGGTAARAAAALPVVTRDLKRCTPAKCNTNTCSVVRGYLSNGQDGLHREPVYRMILSTFWLAGGELCLNH